MFLQIVYNHASVSTQVTFLLYLTMAGTYNHSCKFEKVAIELTKEAIEPTDYKKVATELTKVPIEPTNSEMVAVELTNIKTIATKLTDLKR